MSRLSRRMFVGELLAATAPIMVSTKTYGQSALTEAQRSEYGRIFATSKELSVIHDIQQKTVALPAGQKNLSAFIQNSGAMRAMRAGETPELGMFIFWHGIALEATALDHTTGQPIPSTYGENLGPCRTSRAMAIVHLAMFEAINTIFRRYTSYMNLQKAILQDANVSEAQIFSKTVSVKEAIINSAYDALVAIYPEKRALFDAAKTSKEVQVGDSDAAKMLGLRIGKAAAKEVVDLRRTDGWEWPDLASSDFPTIDPLVWHNDPVVPNAVALGGNWARVRPFVIASASKYRPKPPPAPGSPEFIDAFKETKRLGGDPTAPTVSPRWPTPTVRTGADGKGALDDGNQTFKGIYWAYDGTALLCAPPRLYNMIVTSIATKEKPVKAVDEMARLLALANVAMADAAIAAWEAKYFYAMARPVTLIRELDADNTQEGKRNPDWTPLGAPVSNGKLDKRNLTPNFPSYPSGHATFGGALFEVLRQYWSTGPDGVKFEFLSDEYNGLNRGPGDVEPRPKVPRTFPSFTAAETENGFSRVWLGIHWRYDSERGIKLGNTIGKEVVSSILRPK